MKTTHQAAACLLALGALLSGPAAQATDVAELPLKSSVLARPNVIFGMDDSGSMDWEFLLDTSSGLFWWDGDDGWDSGTGKPRRTKHPSYWGYAYLMPVGTDTGGQIYAHNSPNGLALPPTNQFAWLRSTTFNPLYYDTSVTYDPWAPAYHDGAVRNYGNASTSATLSHPAYSTGPTLNVGDDWNSSDGNWTSNGYRYYVQAGMVLPSGTRVRASSTSSGICSGGTERTLTTSVTVQPGFACWASVPHYPATFWHAEDCTIGADCVLGPDGATKLRRYEIRNGNSFPSGRSHAAELQNFANWFSYYRKRKLMLAGSMGAVLEDLTGLRVGLMKFTDEGAATPTVTMYDSDNPNANLNGRRVAGDFYKNALFAEGTPTHATVNHIAKQFNENTSIVQYACQRNSMFIVTDGFSNTTSITPPSWDAGKSAATWGDGAPYQTTANGTLADLALRYYTNRLRTDLAAGKVPPSSSTEPNADRNTDLHINTYAISLGVRGSLWPTDVDPFETAPTWTTPVADDPSLIDDQWHATINGRGLMFLATNPAETTAGIRAVLNDIVSQRGAQGGVAVSTVNLSRGDNRAYFGTYNPSGWQGDITAHPIDAATGEVDPDTTLWSAGATLLARDWTTRVIASGSSAFTAAGVGATVNPGGVHGDSGQVIEYLRGDRTHEGTLFRNRQSLIGAVINSEPAVQRTANVIYVQSGEGMLHAIDTAVGTAGSELWAFVPPAVLPNIGETVQRSYVFRTQLDGSPTLGTYAGGTLLVAGMGAAGRGFYALDVTSPRGLTESDLAANYKWQFPAAGDAATAAKVGQSLGRPRIVKTSGDGYVVLVTSGYNNTADGHGRLWMLNASTGAVIHEFDTGVGTLGAESGLAQVSAFAESDGTARYVFGGDLLGNVWRFDLKDKGAPHKLATLKDSSNVAQPVTAAPELTKIDGKRVVIVGTGRILDIGDFGSTRTQSLYVITDGTTIANVRSSLVPQTYNPATDTMSGDEVDWSSDRGWFVDLPAGEQANTAPTIAYGAVAFVTNKNGGTDCSASSRLYVLDVKTGGAFEGTDFVSSEISSVANSSGVTALATNNGKIIGSGQDADGKPWEREIVKNGSIAPAKNAWREIRRQ
ncbi:pilus assembly protein [Rubrivivax albus]|uniref:Pyrrolo-quinoline quinone n=1 Tax=Rubrivivax albus TaxID=2499835 RepID=A0A437JVK8_9BURK|nr:PilC/PilY family type IV pilus protein [Rubrivivax albus]RVT51435.1 pyrrolo-quinoline quinone [Rubrivivax albus]